MTERPRLLTTRRGPVPLPAFVPVSTFDADHPLDALLRPYLPRLAHAVLVSYPYARRMGTYSLRLPLFLDSGGFALLEPGGHLAPDGPVAALETPTGRVHPWAVLDLQEAIADVAFTLDFPIAPETPRSEARQRTRWTRTNAAWACANRRRRDLPLFGCAHGWDAPSYAESARSMIDAGCDGVAVGGLVPRQRDGDAVRRIVAAVVEVAGGKPIHAFGLGRPEQVRELFQLGVSSVDSSSYVQAALEGRRWNRPGMPVDNPSLAERLTIALCNLALATGVEVPLAVATRW